MIAADCCFDWPAFLDGRLPHAEAQALSAHLSNCAACRASLDNLTSRPELRLHRSKPSNGDDLTPLLGRLRALAAIPTVSRDHTSELQSPVRNPQLAIDQYRIVAERGRGGMSVVYEAIDPTAQRSVAIKVMQIDESVARERLIREAQAVAALRNDYVVPLFAVGDPHDGPPYLVMPLITGSNLRDRIRTMQGLGPADAARIIREVADGLAAAHAAGLVHRDVKPANVLLDESDGRAKLVDFGLVRPADATATITKTGSVLGTPEYMSPEQWTGRCDARSDVYSLGVTLYEALTGVAPFRGPPASVMQQALNAEPVPPRRLNARVPRDLNTICLKALAKEPARRYSSAADVRDDLGRWLDGRPIRARPPGPIARLVRLARRRPLVAALTAALVLAVCAVVVQWRRAVASAAAAVAERQRADDHFELARQAVDKFFVRYYADSQKAGPPAYREQFKPILDDALGFYRAILDSEPRHSRSLRLKAADTAFKIGWLMTSIGKTDEAIDYYKKCLADSLVILDADANDADALNHAARACQLIGYTYFQVRNYDAAEPEFRRALLYFNAYLRIRPDDAAIHANLAMVNGNLAGVASNRGDNTAARAAYMAMIPILEELARRQPNNKSVNSQIGRTYNNLGIIESDAEAALAWHLKARAVREANVKIAPKDGHQAALDLARTICFQGHCLLRLARDDEAEAVLADALVQMRSLYVQEPEVLDVRKQLAAALTSHATAILRRGELARAKTELDEAERLLNPVATNDAKATVEESHYLQIALAALCCRQRQWDDAVNHIHESARNWSSKPGALDDLAREVNAALSHCPQSDEGRQRVESELRKLSGVRRPEIKQ